MESQLPDDLEIVEEEMDPVMTEDVTYAVDDSNETTVFVQQGEFVVPLTGHTVLLQNEEGVFQHYLINDNALEKDSESEKPIVFYTNDESSCEENLQNENITPYTFVLEESTQNNLPEDEQLLIDTNEINSICQYAILKDGRLHLQKIQTDNLELSDNNNQQKLQEQIDALQQCIDDSVTSCDAIDLDKITGRNLITGQTVTLDHYFDKLQKRLNSDQSNVTKSNIAIDESLINKKVTIGKTANGKKIVGKILHVQSGENAYKRAVADNEEPKSQPNIIIKRQIVTQKNFDLNIGKTLVGLMGLHTVQHKLRNKNLIVKLVDKVYNSVSDNFTKTISYVYGHMELINENWNFILHNQNENSEGVDENVKLETNMPFSLTILTIVDRDGKKSMRVNLNPQHTQVKCDICGKEFKNMAQMNRHLSTAHVMEKLTRCDMCGKDFINSAMLQRHKRMHCSKSHQCTKCPKSFNTAGSLKRHLTIHDPSLRPLECTVCSQRFTDESSLRKHLLIHTGIKAYTCDICARAFRNRGDLNFHRRIHDPIKLFSCDVCGRAFSRHSNLVRHTDIHRGTGVLHQCEVCGCSYSFISSLTRHIVQKHLNEEDVQE